MNENNDITQRSFWDLPTPGIIATHYGNTEHNSVVIVKSKTFEELMNEVFDQRELKNYFYQRVSYRSICEGIPGKGCLKGENAAGEICDVCKGTGFKIENNENKTS